MSKACARCSPHPRVALRSARRAWAAHLPRASRRCTQNDVHISTACVAKGSSFIVDSGGSRATSTSTSSDGARSSSPSSASPEVATRRGEVTAHRCAALDGGARGRHRGSLAPTTSGTQKSAASSPSRAGSSGAPGTPREYHSRWVRPGREAREVKVLGRGSWVSDFHRGLRLARQRHAALHVASSRQHGSFKLYAPRVAATSCSDDCDCDQAAMANAWASWCAWRNGLPSRATRGRRHAHPTPSLLSPQIAHRVRDRSRGGRAVSTRR